MSPRTILRWPDPRLVQLCAPVTSFDAELKALAEDMLATMYDAPGRGLAAPQIGVLKRIFVIDVGWKEGRPTPLVLVNPVIEWVSEELATGPEACLSIPAISRDITRPASLTMRWQGLGGASCRETFTAAAAKCAQHELDHLNGLVIFDRMPPEARAKALDEYAT